MEANYGSSGLLRPPPAGFSVFEAVLADFLARAAAPGAPDPETGPPALPTPMLPALPGPVPAAPAAPAVPAPAPVPADAGLLDGWESLPPVKLAARLAATDRDTLDPAAVIDYLRAAARVSAWAASLSTGALARFAALRPPGPEEGRHGAGNHSRYAGAEIAAALNLHHGTAARILADAVFIIGELPGTFAAMEAGLIGPDRAGLIAGAAADLPAEILPAFEDAVLPAAPGLTPGRLQHLAGHQRNLLHPVSLEDRHAAAAASSNVTVRPRPDARGELCAVMPAHHAVALYRCVDAIARSLQGPAEPRSLGRLRAQVMYELATGQRTPCTACTHHPGGGDGGTDTAGAGTGAGAAAAGAGTDPVCTRDPARTGPGHRIMIPGFTATASLETLTGLAQDPGSIPGFGDIPPSMARDLARMAKSWLPVLTDDADGRFLRAARRKRTPPKGLRRWIQLRDGHCRIPGCDRPAASCDIDHTVPWEHGGPTVPGNLELLCPAHHRLKHEAGWQVRQLPEDNGSPGTGAAPPGGNTPGRGGRLEWITPTGHRYTDDPPPF